MMPGLTSLRYAGAVRHLFAALILIVVASSAAKAQVKEPISPYAVDFRVFYSGLGQDPTTAANLNVAAGDLPKRGLGGVLGIHGYPLRGQRLALGIGGEVMLMRGRATQKSLAGEPTTEPPVQQRIFSIAPAISLNFGTRDGWSYVTAGMGPMSFATFQGEERPPASPPTKNTINAGGGARWFLVPHVAFTFDIRFYLTRPEEIAPPYPGRQRSRLRVLSAGISIR